MFLNAEYAIIVKAQTRLERLMKRSSTASMARFQVESQGGDFGDYQAEHEVYQESLQTVQKNLSKILRNKIVEREFVPSFIFKGQIPLVLVIGQDGLVANVAKYVDNIPILAVNPEPSRYDGVLLPFRVDDFLNGVERVVSGKYVSRQASLAEVRFADGQRLLAFNDLFIGAASHVSARYRIRYEKTAEEQSSSGIIISTKSGSSGWLSSVFNMSTGLKQLMKSGSGKRRETASQNGVEMGENELFFVVREPFKSQRTGIDIIGGPVRKQGTLQVESMMPGGGIIFSDGIESDFLHFNSGTIAHIGIAKETASLVQKNDDYPLSES